MGATKQLAEYLVNTQYDDLSPEAVRRAKELILNFLGVTLDGSKARSSKMAMDHVKRMSARAEASVIGGDYKTTAAFSAYVNGASSHAHELEAVGMSFNSAPSIAPALSIAEKRGLSGKEVLEGFVLGFDVQGRVINGSRAAIGRRGWIMPLNHVGAVSVSTKMMGLDVDQTRAAMGTCLAEASGMQSSAGFLNHYLAFSFPILNAVEAAEYAKEGLGGNPDILEVPEGFCDFFAGIENTDFEKMTKDLGKDYSTILPPGTGIKKYPCCFVAHKAVDAALDLIAEHDISYDDVDYMQIDTNKMVMGWLQYPEPTSEHQGRFSMPHILATTLLNKRVWLDTMTNSDVVLDPKYVEARKKIRIELNPDWAAGTEGWRTPVTIKLKDGTALTKEVDPVRELSSDELLDLYRTIVEPHMSPEHAERSIELVMTLEEQNSIAPLMTLFT